MKSFKTLENVSLINQRDCVTSLIISISNPIIYNFETNASIFHPANIVILIVFVIIFMIKMGNEYCKIENS